MGVAAELGAEVVQILDNIPLTSLPPDDIRRLARRAKELGIAVEIGMRGGRPDQIRRHLDIAAQLDSPLLRIVLEDEGWEPSPAEARALLLQVLPDLRAAGVTLAIENRFHFLPAQVAGLIQDLADPHVRACLDHNVNIGLRSKCRARFFDSRLLRPFIEYPLKTYPD